MAVEQERHPSIGAQRFLDTFTVEKTMIEDRHDRRLAIADRAVNIDRCLHRVLFHADHYRPDKHIIRRTLETTQ